MAISTNSLHAQRVANQCVTLLINIQRDLTRNAQSHKAMADGQTVPLSTLQGWFSDTAKSYQKLLGHLKTYQAQDVTFADALTANGVIPDDVAALLNEFGAIATEMQSADLSSYAGISTACDLIIAQVPAPPSLWPE